MHYRHTVCLQTSLLMYYCFQDAGNRRFRNIPSSLAATFFMMLDNLQYDNILLNYKGSAGNGLVLYVLYIAYCFMMPIIFLNLLVSHEDISFLTHR